MRGKGKSKQPRGKAPRSAPETTAKKASRRGRKMYANADAVHATAEKLHRASESAHRKASELRYATKAQPPGSRTKGSKPTPKPEASERRESLPAFAVVGIGASAGGFEALCQLVAGLPTDTGMAFVIVQHLDPTHESMLTQLLAAKTALPVREIRNGEEVQPNCIYVVPPNANVVLNDGVLRLIDRKGGEMPPMPIDRFFRSLAEAQQEGGIGVILSGTGTDGTLGLEAIKGSGGVSFAQDERSAKYFGMPGSAISTGAVDFILPPDEIARQLGRIASHPAMKRMGGTTTRQPAQQKTPWDDLLAEGDPSLNAIFGLLRARTAVDFSLYKHTTLRRRIIRRMVLQKKHRVDEYIDFLESNPAEVEALFDDLLIKVTTFFRDPQAFRFLQAKVFPKIIKSKREDSPLRIWVCGCSSGEEAYSLAICISEYFDRTRTHRSVQIFATDISETAIERARAGIYPESISQDVSPERLRRYFGKSNGHYQVNKTIRDMCVFARQNVISDPPFSNLDLISCRNVLIYLGRELQRKIIPMFHYALRPEGLLMLGGSETIDAFADCFKLINKRNKVYSRKLTFQRTAFEMPFRMTLGGAKEAVPAAPAVGEAKGDNLAQEIDRILLRDYTPAAVVIDSRMEVLQFRGRTAAYLANPPGVATLNLLKMARESLALDLRSLVAKAIKCGKPIQKRGIQIRENGHTVEISIEVTPFGAQPVDERLFLVVFQEIPISESDGAVRSGRAESSKAGRAHQQLEQMRTELQATKESLQAIFEAQEATNEELKSANEEIQSSNEELQSTNEELETAKEELQSTNEELTTLNEELQNRNRELTVVNNDVTNLLNNVNVAILMLGNDLTIRRFTPVAERIFHLIPSDVGRRLSDMTRSVLIPNLEESIREVIDNLSAVEREVQDQEGRWFSLRIRPYRTRENKIDGAVIMLIDIDELKRALENVLTIVKQPFLILSPDLHIKRANAHFLRAFDLGNESVENKVIYEVAGGRWNVPKMQTLLEAILPENRQVDDYEVEMEVRAGEKQKVRISARRVYENTLGMQMIFLAIEVPKAAKSG